MGRGISPKAVLNTAVLRENRGFSEKTSVLRTAAFEAVVRPRLFGENLGITDRGLRSRGLDHGFSEKTSVLRTAALFQTTAVSSTGAFLADRGF